MWWSSRFDKLLGYFRGEIEPCFSSFKRLLHDEDRRRVLESIDVHLRDNRLFDVECKMRTKQDEYRWFHIRGQATQDDTGRAPRMSGSIRDITARKQRQQHDVRRAKLNEIVRIATSSFLHQELNPSIDLTLAEVGRFLGATRSYLLQYHDGDRWLHNTHEWCAQSVPPRKENLQRVPAQQYRWWSRQLSKHREVCVPDVQSSTVPDPIKQDLQQHGIQSVLVLPVWVFGQLQGFLGFEDAHAEHHWHAEEVDLLRVLVEGMSRAFERLVMDRQRLSNATKLEEALHLAEQASQQKSQFLANMSHEIRTPLTAIVGYADMINYSSCDPDDARQAGLRIKSNADHLLTLINDILDLSKIEAGQLTLTIEEHDLIAIVAEVMSLLRPRAIEKGLSLRITFDNPVPQSLRVDLVRFRQVMLNLVGNAIKFTDAGGITVHVDVDRSTGSDDIKIQFAVKDTGIGIDPDKIGSLFTLFSQVHDPSRQFGGTGLGLAISRRLARMMNGDIQVESLPGTGSIFKLVLNIEKTANLKWVNASEALVLEAEESCAVPVRADLDGRRILVTDDSRDNQNVIGFLLEESGAKVSFADNGQQAVEAVVAASEKGEPFDLILLDMQMPIMDGYTAATEIRRRCITTPVVALTAYALREDRDKCLAAGCDDYATKPIVPEQFFKIVKRRLADTNATPPKRSPAEPTSSTVNETPAAPPSYAAPVAPAPSERGLSSMFANDPRFQRLIEEYLKAMPEMIDQIHAAQKDGDREVLCTHVHRLKGTAANYGFQQITDVARQCESILRGSGNMDDATKPLNELVALMQSAVAQNRPVAKT